VIRLFDIFKYLGLNNKIMFKNKEQQLQAQEITLPPKRASDSTKEKRDTTIRIRKYNYDRLAKLGDISWDFDDALTLVLDHWDKTKDIKK
jgi:hypothetical protein